MASVLARRFDDVRAGRVVQLFKSHRDGIADGDQRRDFIYVDDVVRVMMWLFATPSVSGLFNVGTSHARSFRDLILAAYSALGTPPQIEYIDMPEQIRDSYQYFTESEGDRLRARRLQWRLHAARGCGGFLRQGLPRRRRSLPLIALQPRRVRCSISTPCCNAIARHDGAVRRRPDARRIRLWRGVADFAGSARAGDRGPAQRDQCRRRRQRRAQHRGDRRALHLRRPDRRRRGRPDAECRARARTADRAAAGARSRRDRPPARCGSSPSISRPTCCAPIGRPRRLRRARSSSACSTRSCRSSNAPTSCCCPTTPRAC